MSSPSSAVVISTDGSPLSAKRLTAFSTFKELVADVLDQLGVDDYVKEDLYLQKWLIAREWNPKKAAELFKQSLAYKEQMKVSTILQWYKRPEVIAKYVPGGFCGHDKLGRIVRIDRYAELDMKGLMYSVKRVDLERDKLYDFEYIRRDNREMTAKLGKRVDGLVVILDLTDVSAKMFWQPGIKTYLFLVKMMEDNYPDHLRKMFIINAPTFFSVIYKITRPLISSDMRKKIIVLGDNYSSVLLEHIDAEELPAYLGGKKTDPDGNPDCRTYINRGGQIPESYYLKDKVDRSGMEETVIAARSRYCLNVKAKTTGSIIKFEFMTEGADVGFGVVHQNFDGTGREPVLKIEKYDCHIVPEQRELVVKQPGLYIAVFDNSSSWTKSKRLWYRMELHEPDPTLEREVSSMSDTFAGTTWKNLEATVGSHDN